MGLDMFLSTNSKKVCKAAIEATDNDMWRFHHGTAIYWRKANAIHHWFVENVQYGSDDCGTYDVSVEQLIELRDTCKKVVAASKLAEGDVFAGKTFNEDGELVTMYERGLTIEDSSVAEKLLPTCDGFFFGSTYYDEYYFDDLVKTVRGIDAILDNIEQYDQHSVGDLVWTSWREKGEVDEWNVTFTYHASW